MSSTQGNQGSNDPNNQPPPPKQEEARPPLEDFVCLPPCLHFINMRKLAQAAKDVRAYQKAILSYRPTDHFIGIHQPHQAEVSQDSLNIEPPDSPTENTDPLPAHLIEQIPALAASPEIQDYPHTQEFEDLLHQQEIDRQNLAFSFRKEHSQILNNCYDAQLRENMQKNDLIDHRPLSDALRYISKRISYPIDLGIQRFYKYNFRCEKMIKRHKKALEKLQQSQDLRADILYQKQLQDIQAYGDIQHIDVSDIKVPRIPIPPVRDFS